MPKVRVAVIHYNNWELTHARLWELYRHEKDFLEEVLVVDDGSVDNMTEGGLRWWAEFRVRSNFKVEALVLEENVNFLLAANAGMKLLADRSEPDDIIILLSNDVKIMTKFVGQITEILSQPKKLVGGTLYTHDTGWNNFNGKIFPYLEGWLIATTAATWKELNYFDERYVPHDFEDVDLSTTALSLGMELIPLNNPGLQHIGGQSIGYSPAREAITRTNLKKFGDKWIK